MLLENLTWLEVSRLKLAKKIVLLPLGAFEQHGPHLPLTTDADLVTAVARGVEEKRPAKILCLPTVWMGHSTHHMRFPGTLSVRQMPYIQLLIELCASMVNLGAKKILLLNGHGGNDIPARATLRELKTLFPKTRIVFANYWSLADATITKVRTSRISGAYHACEMETSLMLHLHPGRVRMALAKPDGSRHHDLYRQSDLQHARPVYFVDEFHEVSRTGVSGRPDLATAAKGKQFFEGIVEDVTTFVDTLAKW